MTITIYGWSTKSVDRGLCLPRGGPYVLTAGHAVDYQQTLGAQEQLLVRFQWLGQHKYPFEYTARILITDSSEQDIAIVEIDDPSFDQSLVPVRWAEVDRDNPQSIDQCWAMGFPKFNEKNKPSGSGVPLRDGVQVAGGINPGSNRGSETLELLVTARPSDQPIPNQSLANSPWEGMSGAVVFAPDGDGGYVAVGVVVEHHRPAGTSCLTLAPVSALVELLHSVPEEASRDPVRVLAVDNPTRWVRLPHPKESGTSAAVTYPHAYRVSDTDPRWLGVHRAIEMSERVSNTLPLYVLRDVDLDGRGLRARLSVIAKRGGFILLIGGSSAGTTRSGYEAIQAVLADWWVVYPANADQVGKLAGRPSARTVVWLDEIQRYFDGEHGLTAETIRTLLAAAEPIAIVGTIWPERYAAYTVVPAPAGPDPHQKEREVLELAHPIRIRATFSREEQARARAAATHDSRIRVALETPKYGLTQALAAAPQLVSRWEDADPYARAVLTAAIDITRLGANAPLSANLLRAAAVDYCTPEQRAIAQGNWFEAAAEYATHLVHGAARALIPVTNEVGMGSSVGYVFAEYLLHYASTIHRRVRVPAGIWNTLSEHIRDPNDAARLAEQAENRMLYGIAESLYRVAAPSDDRAARRLAALLVRRGGEGELRTRADAGDDAAADELATILVERGDKRALQARFKAGDRHATLGLAFLYLRHGRVLRATKLLRSLPEDFAPAGCAIAYIWTKIGKLRMAIDAVRPGAETGDRHAQARLAELLYKCSDEEELRNRADKGDPSAQLYLAKILEDRRDEKELRVRADDGDWFSANRLAHLLVARGAEQELRTRADQGDSAARGCLAELLHDRGSEPELRMRANKGDVAAACRLADLLESEGQVRSVIDLLRPFVDEGDTGSSYRLASILARHGLMAELQTELDAGNSQVASVLHVAGIHGSWPTDR